MKKKVGIITLHLGFGGVELASITLANMLSEKYDVTIINVYQSEIAFKIDEKVKVETLSKIYPNKKEFNDALKSKNPIKIIKEGTKALKILYLRKRLVKEYLKENKFDIVISTRFLYTKLINKMEIDALKIAIEHRHHNNDYNYINRLVKACKNIDYLVPVSKGLSDDYAKFLGEKCLHIPNAIDFLPKGNKKKENIIISVGRLSNEKGFDDLIRIFEKVNEKHKNWKLVIAGDGPLKETLFNQRMQSKYKENIIFTGFLTKEKLRDYYSRSSIYVMTSHEEAFPLVIMEAQSFSIPCVTYSTAKGATEMILKGNGFIIEGRNEKEIIKKINILIEDDELREKMAKESYKNSKKYTFRNVQKEWLLFLEKGEKDE